MAYNHVMHLPDNPDAALLERVEAFLKAHEEVSARQLGIATMKDGWLVGHLRKGERSLSLKNARKILRFIEDYKPEGETA